MFHAYMMQLKLRKTHIQISKLAVLMSLGMLFLLVNKTEPTFNGSDKDCNIPTEQGVLYELESYSVASQSILPTFTYKVNTTESKDNSQSYAINSFNYEIKCRFTRYVYQRIFACLNLLKSDLLYPFHNFW